MLKGPGVQIELPPHGTFSAPWNKIQIANAKTKARLVKDVADIYGGGLGKHSTLEYWKDFDKFVLAVIVADCGMGGFDS